MAKSLRENFNAKTITLNIYKHYFGYAPLNTEYFPEEMLNDLNKISSHTNDALVGLLDRL